MVRVLMTVYDGSGSVAGTTGSRDCFRWCGVV